MTVTRRSFMAAAAAAAPLLDGAFAPVAPGIAEDRFDPWIEVLPKNLRFNTAQVARLAQGRPIIAVVKNNAYGVGLIEAARVLEADAAVAAFAVVKTDEALSLRKAGIKKPVLLMGMCTLEEGRELLERDVQLSLYTDDAAERVAALAEKLGRPVKAHLYLDTGLGRLGMPFHRGLSWLETLPDAKTLDIRGTFMAFTEEQDFDPKQITRFEQLVREARAHGARLGRLHAASSNGVFHLKESHLDLVRPGIALFGGYPSRWEEERRIAELRVAVRLRCRVVRVERLRKGDSAGYGRKYVAKAPTWLATLPVGHVDGVPRSAVEGAHARIGSATYPVVGAVSASHCIVELGADRTASVGDVATLIDPDDRRLSPNAVAAATGASVYDVLMHLSPTLPRVLV